MPTMPFFPITSFVPWPDWQISSTTRPLIAQGRLFAAGEVAWTGGQASASRRGSLRDCRGTAAAAALIRDVSENMVYSIEHTTIAQLRCQHSGQEQEQEQEQEWDDLVTIQLARYCSMPMSALCEFADVSASAPTYRRVHCSRAGDGCHVRGARSQGKSVSLGALLRGGPLCVYSELVAVARARKNCLVYHEVRWTSARCVCALGPDGGARACSCVSCQADLV
jgi:hypothetical protein